jgi:3-dehydroquinate synthase
VAGASELTIHARSGNYGVRIGEGLFDGLLDDRGRVFLIADAFFTDRLEAHTARTILVPAREGRKTLSGAEEIIERLRDLGVTRGDELLGVGGGILQDLATAVASLYMRGLPWHYAPTTLLAMVDSCIGGKSSLNVGPYKNLAGNFHPPGEVIVDPRFIDTLGEEDRAGGLCEAMKICFCRGPRCYETYLERHRAFESDPTRAVALLHHVLSAKKWFIEIDEFDRAERRQLNFGHTFGHALEAATGFAVSHGIAVGLGVVCAERLAVAVDGQGAGQPGLREHALALVRAAPDLSRRLGSLDWDLFERALLSDKKHGADGLHLMLPDRGGGVTERVLANNAHTLSRVREALDETIRMVQA